MKKYLLFLLLLSVTVGCNRAPKEKEVLAKINDYEITKEEFEEEFKNSSFGREDTLESRKEFFNNLVNHKLILQEAQRENIDKDKGFLKSIERFWEQTLLKIILDKKTKEFSGSVRVDEQEVRQVYQKLQEEGKADRSYEEMYSQIKWELSKLRESQQMNDWIAHLRGKAHIKLNYDLLNENQ